MDGDYSRIASAIIIVALSLIVFVLPPLVFLREHKHAFRMFLGRLVTGYLSLNPNPPSSHRPDARCP